MQHDQSDDEKEYITDMVLMKGVIERYCLGTHGQSTGIGHVAYREMSQMPFKNPSL